MVGASGCTCQPEKSVPSYDSVNLRLRVTFVIRPPRSLHLSFLFSRICLWLYKLLPVFARGVTGKRKTVRYTAKLPGNPQFGPFRCTDVAGRNLHRALCVSACGNRRLDST